MKRILFLLAAGLLIAAVFMAFGEEKGGDGKVNGYWQIDQETAKEMMARDDGHIVVDVRRRDEYDAGHIPGAVLIPNENINCDSPEALPDYDQIILIYCRSGNRSKQAAQKLAGMGYTNIYEFGGIITWTGDVVTTAEEEAALDAREAVLRFSSFAGGGYEYTVEVDDPTVARCEGRYEYEAHAEEIDGASFDYIVTFTGLKPGTATVTVYGRSPVMENENSVYTVTVDEALRVTLSPVRAISYFYVHRSGEINYDTYQITMDERGYHLLVNEQRELPADQGAVSALMDVIDDYDMASWDGFRESQPFMLDGESFWIDFTLTDGTTVHASGDNAFPARYFDAMGSLWEILMGMADGEGK